jgi:hypothetical protein
MEMYVEAEQARRGLAWVYRQYSDDRRLLALEAETKAARRGLWVDANPLSPWGRRHGGKAAATPSEPAPVPSATNRRYPATASWRVSANARSNQSVAKNGGAASSAAVAR